MSDHFSLDDTDCGTWAGRELVLGWDVPVDEAARRAGLEIPAFLARFGLVEGTERVDMRTIFRPGHLEGALDAEVLGGGRL